MLADKTVERAGTKTVERGSCIAVQWAESVLVNGG